jgi:hypothetical protein
MNHQSTTLIVRSSDGVEFAVETDRRAVPWELAFAARYTAAQLAAHGDYVRVEAPLTEQYRSLDDLPEVSRVGQLEIARHVRGGCSPKHEALCLALARWHTAAVIQRDRP